MSGFYSPTTWDRVKQPLPTVRQCGACGLFKEVRSPFMKVSGEGRRKVLVVAEAPGETEDERGYQLCGNAGQELIRLLLKVGVNMRRDCWLDNAVVCRPMERNQWDKIANRTPTGDEIKHCQPGLVQTLRDLEPDVIIPLGGVALKSLIPLAWKSGEVDEVEPWVGWQIPSQTLNAWICPTYHPSFLLHNKTQAAELHVLKHLKAAFELDGKPWVEWPFDHGKLFCEMITDPYIASKAINNFVQAGKPCSFDFETTTLKPDGPYARIICFSISDGERSVACPWHALTAQALTRFLISEIPKYGAMMKFEERWSRIHLGVPINNWTWDCVNGQHWLDCRGGICSVKFQSFVRFGTPDYDSSIDKFKSNPDDLSNEPNRLDQVDPYDLMLYNALDSLYEHWIAQEQMKEGGYERV